MRFERPTFFPEALARVSWRGFRRESGPSRSMPSKIRGVYDVREGDHVDLLASIPVDMPGANHSGGATARTS